MVTPVEAMKYPLNSYTSVLVEDYVKKQQESVIARSKPIHIKPPL